MRTSCPRALSYPGCDYVKRPHGPETRSSLWMPGVPRGRISLRRRCCPLSGEPTKFSTMIADVATTGNSGPGVFDPNHKCLLGIMSRKFFSHTTEGDKDIAKYFIPAAAIRAFMPAELKL